MGNFCCDLLRSLCGRGEEHVRALVGTGQGRHMLGMLGMLGSRGPWAVDAC